MTRTQKVFLVVRSNGDVRVAKRPRVAMDEIAVAVTLHFPAGWGTVAGVLDIKMPAPPTATTAEVAK
jgi:hypothetical protein